MGHTTKDEDVVVALIPARSLDTMLFFSDRGKVYSEKVYQIPDADRAAKGIPLVNVLALDPTNASLPPSPSRISPRTDIAFSRRCAARSSAWSWRNSPPSAPRA
jgi:hypothetical protein